MDVEITQSICDGAYQIALSVRKASHRGDERRIVDERLREIENGRRVGPEGPASRKAGKTAL